MSDSINTFRTRGELYEQYKQSNPALAKIFLGKKYNDISFLTKLGVIFLVSAIVMTIIFLSVDGTTGGFGPASAAHGGVAGAIAAVGLSILAIMYYKNRKILGEQLSEGNIQAIIIQKSIPLETIKKIINKK